MILGVDTHYSPASARTAGVLFEDWGDAEPAATHVLDHSEAAAAYEPGAFFRRELPLILAFLRSLPQEPRLIVVDGYVTLDDAGRKGLGAHLFEALEEKVPVIGVAKRPFAGSRHAEAVLRGRSERPLYVTAKGLSKTEAASAIARMHGPHRLPTLLKLADRLFRHG